MILLICIIKGLQSNSDTMKEHLGMNAKRILVVDDEPDILEFLQVILEEEGYLVLTSQRRSISNNCTMEDCPTSSYWMSCSQARMAGRSSSISSNKRRPGTFPSLCSRLIPAPSRH